MLTLLNLAEINTQTIPASVVAQLYIVALKRGLRGTVYYGRQTYHFHDGLLTFLAPGQVVQADASLDISAMTGWALVFHPDLLRKLGAIGSCATRKDQLFTCCSYRKVQDS